MKKKNGQGFQDNEDQRDKADSYSGELDNEAERINKAVSNQDLENVRPDFRPIDDSASSEDEEGVTDEDLDNVSEQEAYDLDQMATRMPGDENDIEDTELDDLDFDGTELNEGNDPLGEDLDITEEDADANEYDDNQ